MAELVIFMCHKLWHIDSHTSYITHALNPLIGLPVFLIDTSYLIRINFWWLSFIRVKLSFWMSSKLQIYSDLIHLPPLSYNQSEIIFDGNICSKFNNLRSNLLSNQGHNGEKKLIFRNWTFSRILNWVSSSCRARWDESNDICII